MNTGVQIGEPPVQISPVVIPRHTVDPGGRIPFQQGIRLPQQINAHVVQECGEPLLLAQPRGCPYAFQTCGHAVPARCPERAWLTRVSFGPAPSLHRLRRRSPVIVRRLRRYYGRV
jgi:hypothetical protein